jgi:Fe-S-cluster containining protein
VIHPVKPLKCRTFPLAWRTPDVCEYCVGMKS